MLQQALTNQHYQVELATDGQAGWQLAETEPYDVILLDWLLPKLSGIEFCQQLRTENHSVLHPNQATPVLLMTAMDAVTHKVRGLNAGADDYIVKPFDLDELLARIRALLRRGKRERMSLLQWGEVCLDPNRCAVTYQEQPLVLATKEYELLELFLRNPEQIFSLDRLLTTLWKVDEMPGEGTVRAHIKGLRQKLKQAGAANPIETLYKLGYRLKSWSMNGEKPRPAGGLEHIQPEHAQTEPTTAAAAFVLPELWDIWQAVRDSYRKRLAVIQQAVTALQHERLTPEQRRAAAQEAHTLVGSLGSFGLEDASHLAHQIQSVLKPAATPGQLEIEKLRQWVAALWLQLGHSADAAMGAIDDQLARPPTASASPLLLIVDAALPWTQTLANEAAAEGWQAAIATTLAKAEPYLQAGTAHALLLNLDWAEDNDCGLDWLAAVRVQYPMLPVVTLTADASLERRITAVRLGSDRFLTTPIAPAQVLAAIAPLLHYPKPLATRILVVDPDLAALQRLSALLTAAEYQVTLLSKPEQFWQTLEQTTPDLLLLAVTFPPPTASTGQPGQASHLPLSGIELCQVIRSDPDWNHLPVVFLSAHTAGEPEQRYLDVGADGVLSKPIEAPALLNRIRTSLVRQTQWGLRRDHPAKGYTHNHQTGRVQTP